MREDIQTNIIHLQRYRNRQAGKVHLTSDPLERVHFDLLN